MIPPESSAEKSFVLKLNYNSHSTRSTKRSSNKKRTKDPERIHLINSTTNDPLKRIEKIFTLKLEEQGLERKKRTEQMHCLPPLIIS